MKKINLWRASFLAVAPISLALMLWLMITLQIDEPKLFLRLLGANAITISYALFHLHKAMVGNKKGPSCN